VTALNLSLGKARTMGAKLALSLVILGTYCLPTPVNAETASTNPAEAKSSAESQSPAEAHPKSSASTVAEAIRLYREKNYVEADRLFTHLHAENPDKTKTTYYLAITKAQEGDFLEAAKLYQEVIQHENGSPLGLLAQQGLKNLPLTATANVDAPPQFQNPYGSADISSYTPGMPAMGGNTMQGVSPTDLMWMQTMMGTNNNNNNTTNNSDWGSWMAGLDANNNNMMNGMNGAMSLPGMPMPNTMMSGGNMPMMNNGKPMDPQVMSSWLTNQMMQNSTMFMNDNNNDNR